MKDKPKAARMLVVCSLELVVTFSAQSPCSKLGEEQHRTSQAVAPNTGTKPFHFGGAWLFRRHVDCYS